MLRKQYILLALGALLALLVTLFLRQQAITILPTQEVAALHQLERTKETAEIRAFTTDGCSGNLSNTWPQVIEALSWMSGDFAERYQDIATLPIEELCTAHDRAYHAGDGGYLGRLNADRALRDGITDYGVQNAAEIAKRLQLQHEEEAIHVYDVIAGVIYGGVRLGGVACTGKPYAWGYGYGACVE